MKTAISAIIFLSGLTNLYAQNVGIGTFTPASSALLHVDLGTSTTKGLLVSGTFDNTFNAPVPNLGPGSRMMFYPGKTAFRAGYVNGTQWDDNGVGFYSTALGHSTTAKGYATTALGYNTKALGDYSTAMGHSTSAVSFATAMGVSTRASGQYSTAMGESTTAGGIYSTAIGRSSIAKGYASTVIGLFNDSLISVNQTLINSTTPLFIIGNGSAESVRSNAMVVLKNGYVGIGSNAPGENLVLNDPANPTLELQSGGVSKGYLQLSGTDNDNLRLGTFSSNTTGNLIVRLNGLDKFTIFPSGNATLTGTLTQNSDVRFKQNIKPIDNALNKILLLNGREYYWKPGQKKDSSLQIGFIAQEVEKILPQLVATDKDGIKSVAYQNLVPVLVEAIKTLTQKIDKLDKQVEELQNNDPKKR